MAIIETIFIDIILILKKTFIETDRGNLYG